MASEQLLRFITYRRSKIIRVKNLRGVNFSRFVPSTKFFNDMDENQVLLAITLWPSGVVIDRAFTLGGADVRAQAYLLIIAA